MGHTERRRLTETDEQELWRVLLIGQRRLGEYFSMRIKQEYGLTSPQFEALLILHAAAPSGLTMSRLSRGLLYSSGSASNLVSRLEELGHVERNTPQGDARSIEVTLTESGAELIEAARGMHFADLDRVFAPLVGEQDRPVLESFFARMRSLSLEDDFTRGER